MADSTKRSKQKTKKVIPFCPSCQQNDNVYTTAQAWGAVTIHYDSLGQEWHKDGTKLNYRESTVVRCSGCGHIRRDLKLVRGGVQCR